jgi:hypothetical protein
MWTFWTLGLLFHLWLTGSLVLPVMLIVRWCGTKWGQVRWLTGSPKRWILICGGYAFFRVVAIAAHEWLKYSTFPGLDFLGWSGVAALIAMPAFLARMIPGSVAYWFVVAISAPLEGLMYCGFAAVAWWTFRWSEHGALWQAGKGAIKRRYFAFLVSTCLWGIANNVHSWRPATCADCFWPHGIPFTFYHEGGFAGGDGYVWTGVVGDAFVVFLCGAILGWAWNRFSPKRLIANRTSI